MENLNSKNSFRLLPGDNLLPANNKKTLLEVLIEHDIDISHSCGGMGSCGTCRLTVKEGLNLLGPRGDVESEIASEYGYKDFERLACQNHAHAGLTIELPRRKGTAT